MEIDPYSHKGDALLTGFTKRINGERRESCTSAEMELGWVKADETVSPAKPKPLARLRIPGVVIGVLAAAASSYAVLAHHYAVSAPTFSYVVPELTSAAENLSAFRADLGRRFHVVLHTEPIPVTKPQGAAGPSVDDVMAQLRAVAAARNALRREHHTAHTAHAVETAPDLLRQGDALLEAGDVAGARVLYGRVAGNGTGPDAMQAADRLNQIDAAH